MFPQSPWRRFSKRLEAFPKHFPKMGKPHRLRFRNAFPGKRASHLRLLSTFICNRNMDSLFQAAQYLSPSTLEPGIRPSWMMTNDDQRFLLYFVMGTYFGPDLKAEKPKRSVLQRLAEGHPPYDSDQLAGSQMKMVEVERIYYYVLRKADQSVVVKLPLLQQFFLDKLFTPSQDPIIDNGQFSALFPPHLHSQSRFKNRYRIIENIVFINNPEISYIKPEDVERFKRLTGLEDFLLDRDAARLHTNVGVIGLLDANMALQEVNSNGKLAPKRSSHSSQKRKHANAHPKPQLSSPLIHDVTPINTVPYSSPPVSDRHMVSLLTEVEARPVDRVGAAMLFLPSHPTTEEWNNIVASTKSGIALTGSAAKRQAGPLIGLVDIGVSEDAYLFRVSLPGVRNDEREFSCEVETDGKVLVKGVTTTGEKTVYKDSQVIEMQSQNLCPSGDFSVSFQLPGPVIPREFSGSFRNGILEGVLLKGR
ncbi:hypothetical protein HHK36_026679 [Tetracentron sinense]|uniref:SHSP domain-containing protein n=1 Tax=Tetracentron sinense TaxID=13715 RepID=A0A834YJX0_TETSI|nr:hypothetical protein HHK36_026679 [Tetracentron sinense]